MYRKVSFNYDNYLYYFSYIIMKKILVTGGSGQLAQSYKLLYSNKYNLLVLDKASFDINDIDMIKYVLDKEKPDIIINCAAMTNVDECERNSINAYSINGLSIKNFATFFNGLFVQISTDYVFDGNDGPYSETSAPNPLSIYGKSKLLGEEIVKKYFKNHLIIRTNVVFDLNDDSSFIDWVIKSLSENKKINVVNDQINNPIWTQDLSKAISFLIDNNKRGIFHIGSDTLCSRYEFAKMIANEWNLDSSNIVSISTVDLFNQLDNYIAKRPLNSGLISKSEILPNISLIDSLAELKKIS